MCDILLRRIAINPSPQFLFPKDLNHKKCRENWTTTGSIRFLSNSGGRSLGMSDALNKFLDTLSFFGSELNENNSEMSFGMSFAERLRKTINCFDPKSN
jgi:hypothetical protein